MYIFFFQAEDGIRDLVRSRGLGDVYKRQYQRRVRGSCVTHMEGAGSPTKPWKLEKPNGTTKQSASRPWAGRATGVRERERQIRTSLKPPLRFTAPPRAVVPEKPGHVQSTADRPTGGGTPHQLVELAHKVSEESTAPSTAAVWTIRLLILCGALSGVRYAASRS
eukprot:TRINITY_DN16961_c0_g1_i1.p1 TRINITY_DN16961_c0_g1~~TRINITY_DN16961_c0_g1_i1.p1  ORF type:complete len:165 (+),score=17.48 TRINITY_DN16961_c0_g1_i1:31-525(+)